jgi:hypothetical protein
MATVFADTAEHDGRYSDVSHKTFSELYVIQALSEPNPTILYCGTWDFISIEVVDRIDAFRAIRLISV